MVRPRREDYPPGRDRDDFKDEAILRAREREDREDMMRDMMQRGYWPPSEQYGTNWR